MKFEELLSYWRNSEEEVKFKRTSFNVAYFTLDKEGNFSVQEDGKSFNIPHVGLNDVLFEEYEILE